MLTQIEFPLARNATKNMSSPLATVLYEDLAAGLRARALMECVERSMDVPTQFKLELWRYDWLGEQSLANVALGMAKRSALVLVSASSGNPLPAVAEKWLTAWTQSPAKKSFSAPMIVLLPNDKCAEPKHHPLRIQLQSLAADKNIDFFCESFKPQRDEMPAVRFRRAGQEEIFTTRASVTGVNRISLSGAERARSSRGYAARTVQERA